MARKARKRIPTDPETSVLTRSRRRCCICFGLNRDTGEKKGQIAHLDQNPGNNNEENLAYLCFDHHDQYDGSTSQSKGLTIGEVKRYRDQLYAAEFSGEDAMRRTTINVETNNGQVAETINNTTINQAPKPELQIVGYKLMGQDGGRYRHRAVARMSMGYGGRMTIAFPPGSQFQVRPEDGQQLHWRMVGEHITIPQPYGIYIIDLETDSPNPPDIQVRFD
jgi:hypothetical protein